MPMTVVAISEPPAITMSASPYWMVRIATPSAWVEVVHADTTAKFGPTQAEADRQMPGDHVDDRGRHEERGNLARVVARLEEGLVLFLDSFQAADAGAHDDAGPVQVDLRRIEARIGHGIHTRRDAVVHELVDAPGFLGRQVFRQLEALRPLRRIRQGNSVAS